MGRLIDADALSEELEKHYLGRYKLSHVIQQYIDDQPTAYYVDKVVAELERKIKDTEKVIVMPPQDKLDEIANDTAKDFIGAWKSAIKVVRKGGVNE